MGDKFATISSGPFGWIIVSFTYDQEAKDALRRKAGRGNYRWIPETRVWCYRRNLLETVRRTLENFGYEVHVDDDLCPIATSPIPSEQQAWRALFHQLPPPVVSKVYRSATRVLHPDQGGNTAAMQNLNLAWEDFTRHLGRN